jgi:signal transduction histidine kinase
MGLTRASLGLKLNLALLAFFIVLGAATAALIFIGFNRTQDTANARSQQGLEELGETALLGVVSGQAAYAGLAVEAAADMGYRGATFLESFQRAGLQAKFDASRLVRTDDGLTYDPASDRISDLAMPNYVELTEPVLDDIAYSAALDSVFPALMQSFPGSLREANFEPIAIAFLSANSVVRYYPPIGIQTLVPADIDITPLAGRLGPEGNPDRKINWRAPYEDAAGKGLVITAEVPVYDGDNYRGTFQVDLSIDKLIAQVNQLKLTSNGFAFYMDQEGQILQGESFALITGEADAGNQALLETLDAMRSGQEGVKRVVIDGEDTFIGYAPIAGMGGSLAMAASVEELTASAAAITADIEAEGQRTMKATLAAMGVLFVLGLVGATYLNRRVLIRPIEALVVGTRSVAAGHLDSPIPVSGDDELAALARSFNDMTSEIVAARDDLELQVEERTRELRALLRISNDVASTLELEPLLALVIEQVKTIADYDRCSIFTLEGDRFVRLDSGSPTGVGISNLSFEIATIEPISSRILRRQAVIIADVWSDTEEALAHQRASGEQFQTAFQGIHSWMAVPLALNDRVSGMLTLSHGEPSFYSERQAGLVGAIATQVAVAIENARLYEQAQKLAAVEERQRLARELHDSVSQALYGIGLGARTARTLLDTDPSRATEPVEYVMQLAEVGLAEMRALIFELRPESLENEGLVAALEKQIAATQARYGISLDTQLGEEPDLSTAEREVFYRITQEAIHNVVKHAHASKVEIRLSTDGNSVSIEVRDDGVGFETDQSFPGHLGLVSFSERAASIGAKIEIESAPGAGTLVRLSLSKP